MPIKSTIQKWKCMHIDYHHIKRFLLSGGSATLLHYTVMGVLIYLGIDPVYATGVGALFGAVFNYILQYHYTFRSTGKHGKTVMMYTLTVAAGLMSNELVFILMYHLLGLNTVMAQLLTTGVVTVQNYFLYKYLVFKGTKT